MQLVAVGGIQKAFGRSGWGESSGTDFGLRTLRVEGGPGGDALICRREEHRTHPSPWDSLAITPRVAIAVSLLFTMSAPTASKPQRQGGWSGEILAYDLGAGGCSTALRPFQRWVAGEGVPS